MKDISIKNIFKVTFVIIGTIIGAGFASGQEIYRFFNVYGEKGIYGIIISIALMGIIIYKVFEKMIINNINTYEEFIEEIIPEKFKSNRIIKFTINNIINIFLLISFYVMASGFATYFSQEIGINAIYGGAIIGILTYLTFCKSINRNNKNKRIFNSFINNFNSAIRSKKI